MARRSLAGWIAGAVLALIAGCSTNEIVKPLDAPELAKEAERPPLPLRLLIAPLEDARELSGSASVTTNTAEADDVVVGPVPQFAPEEFRIEVKEALLERAKAYAHVELADPLPDDEWRRARREPEEMQRLDHELLAGAYEKPVRDHLVLRLKVLRYDVAYLGGVTHPNRYAFAVFSVISWYFPQWWVAAEDFECTLEVQATLVGVASEQPVLRTKTYRAVHRSTLDEWERGLSIMGPVLFRSWSLDESHFAKAAEIVAPPARAKFLAELARDLKAIDPAAPHVVGRHLVSVGAGHFDEQRMPQRGLLSAEEDARSLRDVLVGTGVVPAKNAQVLTSGEATRSAVLGAAKRAAARAAPGDLVYFIFAGFGASVNGAPVLVTADFDPERPLETGVPVSELGRTLGASGRQVVILDASFGGAGTAGTRTLQLPARFRAEDTGALPKAFAALARPGRALVLSAGPRGVARFDDRAGVFTHFLRDALASRDAKPGAQGFVTLNSVFGTARRATANFLADPPQEPAWLGAKAGPTDPGEVQVPFRGPLALGKAGDGGAGTGAAERVGDPRR